MTTQLLAANFSKKIAALDKNRNPGARRERRYLAPRLGNTTVEARSFAMAEFLPLFQQFILAAGITDEMQKDHELPLATSLSKEFLTFHLGKLLESSSVDWGSK